MKRILIVSLITLACGFSIKAQQMPMDSLGKNIIYTEVVQMPGLSKTQLFDRSMKAINNMYKLAEKKVAVKDPEGGLLQMNCSTQVVLKDPKSGLDIQSGYFKYKFNMYFKDGKYKYEFKGFHTDLGGFPETAEKLLPDNNPDPKRRAAERLKILDTDIKRLIGIMKSGMNGEKEKAKQDW
jgi:hypothetical protein